MKTAVIIGAGPSGLIAACILADRGYSVTVLEQNARIGGRLKAENWDGHVVETGPNWLHDSAHPIRAALPKGGLYQNFNATVANNASIIGRAKALAEYYGKPLFQKFANDVYSTLLKHKDKVQDLSWRELIDKIVVPTNVNTPAYIIEIRTTMNRFPYNWYINFNKPAEARKALQELIQDQDINIDYHSIIGGQNYVGSGDTQFLPTGGYSQVIRHLEQEIAKRPNIRIKLNTTVMKIQDHGDIKNKDASLDSATSSFAAIDIACTVMLTSGETFSCDIIIVAIAKHDFFRLKRSENEIARTNLEKLVPSFRIKIAMQLNRNVFLANSVLNKDNLYFTTQGTTPNSSPILYALAYTWDKAKLLSAEETATLALENMVKELFPAVPDLKIIKIQTFHPTGESWYRHQKGFKPVENSGHNIKYLGAVTGCDDSVHSVATRACIELGEDHNKYLYKLFSSKVETGYGSYIKPVLFAATAFIMALQLPKIIMAVKNNSSTTPPGP